MFAASKIKDCNSVVKYLYRMYMDLGSIPSIEKKIFKGVCPIPFKYET